MSELQVWGHRATLCSGLRISAWHRGTIEAPEGEAALGRADTKRGEGGGLLPPLGLGFILIISFEGCQRAFVVGICVPSSRGSPPAAACCKCTLFVFCFVVVVFFFPMYEFERRYV